MNKNLFSVKALLITLVACVVLFVGALVLGFVGLPLIVQMQVESQTELEQGTDQWDRFVDLPFPIDFHVYFWNVNNPDEILNGANPDISEKGPYMYKEYKKKNIISYDSGEDSVTFENEVEIVFDDEHSTGREYDEITVINPIYQTAIQLSSSLERLVLAGCLDKILQNDDYDLNKLFITVKARDLLFDGLLYGFEEYAGVACGIVRKRVMEKARKIKVVDFIYKSDATTTDDKDVHHMKFSMFSFKSKNGTNKEGNLTVNRGRWDSSLLGETIRWRGKEDMDYWGSRYSVNNQSCNKLRGTDATIYHPNIEKDKKLQTFTPDICRIVEISYVGEDSYRGIKGYRFEATSDTLWSVTDNPENDCYCTRGVSDLEGNPGCFLDGVFDYSPCLGAPNLISFPHFLDANPKYSENITGLNPQESEHRIFLLVEPNTGIPLQGQKRVQINSVLRPVSSIDQTKNVPRVLFPMVWVSEGVNLPEKYINLLNDQYFSKVVLADGVKYGVIAVTAALVVVCSVFLVRKKFFGNK